MMSIQQHDRRYILDNLPEFGERIDRDTRNNIKQQYYMDNFNHFTTNRW